MAVERIARLVELGRWREAQQLADSVLAAEPDNLQALGHRTRCLYEQGDLATALDSANRMVALAPDDPWAHRMCSLALDRLGQSDEALRAAAEAVRLDPHDWLSHVRYATAAVDVRGRLWEAKQAAERAVQLAPHQPDAHVTVGLVAQARNEVADARAAYTRALALEPDHPSALNNLAVLDGLHRTVRATRAFASALRSDPQNATVRENLDAMLVNFALVLYLLGGAGVVLALAVVRASDGAHAVRIGAAVCFTVGLAAYVAWVGSRVPRGVRRYALGRWRHEGLAIWNSVLAVVEIGIVYIVCFAPNGEQIGMIALRPVLLTLVIIGVRTLMARTRG